MTNSAHSWRYALLAASILFMLAACSERDVKLAPTPDAATARSLSQGEIIGFRAANGAQVWRGLPFAAPPVAERRWRAPGPAPAFTNGVLEALDHGPACPQLTLPLDDGGLEPGVLIGEEDCLVLDVYAPEGAIDGAQRAVMVWIHGGGNVWGRASQYDASALAQSGDVVVVVIQYRLGPFGWFAHEALREDARGPLDAVANFALLDMVAALDWVQENIAAFGGDPGRVTVFGESAGGHNVAALLASPLAAGKFHRAIIQSGALDTVTRDAAEGVVPGHANAARAVAARFAGQDADASGLRAASMEAVFAGYRREGGFLDLPRMIDDGVTLPAGGIAAALSDPADFNAVPVITGVTRDEARLFHLMDPRFTRNLFNIAFLPRGRAYYEAAAEYPSRAWRLRAMDDLARSLVQGGHEDVWAYRFDWDEGGRLLITDFALMLGAAHSLEIPFVFGDFDLLFGRIGSALFNRGNEAGRLELSGAMIAYWAEFARTGTPGAAPGQPEWTRWRDGGAWLRFDSAADGGVQMQTGEETEAALIADFQADPRIPDARRCEALAALAWRAPDLAQRAGADLTCPAER